MAICYKIGGLSLSPFNLISHSANTYMKLSLSVLTSCVTLVKSLSSLSPIFPSVG